MFFISQCAYYNEDVIRIRSNINMLQNQINNLQDQNSELNSKVGGFSEAISSIRKNQADLGVKIDYIKGDIQKLTGKFEELKYQFEKSPKLDYEERIATIEREIEDIKNRISSLEEVVSEKKALPEKPLTEDDFYKDAYETYKKGDTQSALEKFKKFKATFPDTKYSPNIEYWIGECFYSLKDYERAILSFDEVITKYPKSEKIPSALLKQGYSFLKLNDKKAAKLILERVVNNYPKSEEAKLAKEKLKEINKK